MRVAAGSRPGDRELPPVTPRPSVRLVVPLLFASLPPLPPVLSPLPFFPRSRNNFVKSARRRRNDEGGTTALRGGLYTSLARPQAPRPSNSLSTPFSISRVKPPPAVLLSHLRRRRGARARCVLPLCSPPVRSVLSPYLLLSPSRFLFPFSSSHARDLFRIRASCARPVLLARSLVRSAFALVRSPHRRVQTPRTILSAVPPFARSLAYRPSSSSSSSERLRIRIRSRESSVRTRARRARRGMQETRGGERHLETRFSEFSHDQPHHPARGSPRITAN